MACRQKERRLKEEELRKIKTLGAAADDVDDVSAWINKSRALEEKAKAEARAKALKAAQALEEQVAHPLALSLAPHTSRGRLCLSSLLEQESCSLSGTGNAEAEHQRAFKLLQHGGLAAVLDAAI